MPRLPTKEKASASLVLSVRVMAAPVSMPRLERLICPSSVPVVPDPLGLELGLALRLLSIKKSVSFLESLANTGA